MGGSEANLNALRKALQPLRVTLEDQPFLGGSEANYADLAVAGAFAVSLACKQQCPYCGMSQCACVLNCACI